MELEGLRLLVRSKLHDGGRYGDRRDAGEAAS
jgi:hypothetical protein